MSLSRGISLQKHLVNVLAGILLVLKNGPSRICKNVLLWTKSLPLFRMSEMPLGRSYLAANCKDSSFSLALPGRAKSPSAQS